MLLHAFLTLPPLLLLLPLVLVHSYLAASVAADTITIPFNVTAAVKVGGIHFVNKISANQTVFAIQLLTDLGTLTNKDVSSDCMVVIGGLRYHEDKPIIIDNTTASLNTKFTSRHSSVLASNETLNDCDKDTSIPQDRCAFLLQQQCDITMAPPGSPDSCSPLGTRISPKCGFVAKATTKIAGAESQNTAGAGLVENLYADGPAGQTGIILNKTQD
ncbi:hypothetical protein GQ42DRAFT_170226 [Ramicandelaber brevisporus]|nr:hypothetical protein GQ42DRAFT_170226 [Ramicandelaber brevisporus]